MPSRSPSRDPPLSEVKTNSVFSHSPISSSAARSRPTFWSMLSTMAAYTDMYFENSRWRSSSSSSQATTSSPVSVLRGASSVPGGMTPSSS